MGEKGEGSGGEGGGKWGQGEGTGKGVPPCPPPQYRLMQTVQIRTVRFDKIQYDSGEATLNVFVCLI